MVLREYLRKEWQLYVRQVLLKDKCEECGKTGHLHLHHDSDRFEDLLMETLRELNLKEKDTDDYKQSELNHISNEMIGKQMKIRHRTLCEECHKKAHSKGGNVSYLSNYGGYIFVNFKALKEKHFCLSSKVVDFIGVSLMMDFENQIEKDKFEISNYTLDYLTKGDYIEDKKTMIRLNPRLVKKGTCTFSERNIISIDRFGDIYQKLSGFERSSLGYLLLDNNKERTQIFKKGLFLTASRSDLKKFKNYNLLKTKGRMIMFNPKIILFEPHRLDELKEIYKNF